jgi:hypothetical protein
VFELKEDTPPTAKKLRSILEKNFDKFSAGVRQSEGLKMYFKEGTKMVVE